MHRLQPLQLLPMRDTFRCLPKSRNGPRSQLLSCQLFKLAVAVCFATYVAIYQHYHTHVSVLDCLSSHEICDVVHVK